VFKNTVPLHIDIPHTSGTDSDIHFEAALQEYLHFSYEYFFQFFFYSVVIVVNLVLQRTPEEKIIRIKTR
jgi:hypothetical protein